jgi:hypothetical protein
MNHPAFFDTKSKDYYKMKKPPVCKWLIYIDLRCVLLAVPRSRGVWQAMWYSTKSFLARYLQCKKIQKNLFFLLTTQEYLLECRYKKQGKKEKEKK